MSPTTWHQALAYAVSGRRLPDLGVQPAPDVPALAAELRDRRDRGDLTVCDPLADVPADLVVGIGAAQFWAALAQLRDAMVTERPVGPVTSSRPLSREEQRLDDDRPPHHGT